MNRQHISALALFFATLVGCASAPQPVLQSTPAGSAVSAATLAAPAATAAAVPSASTPASPAAAPVVSRPKATGTPEDARKHIVRGAAAIEMARSADHLVLAADEFRMATEIAPDMAVAWFNLGAVLAKTGQIPEAIAAYRQYLVLSPGAEDAARVGDEIIKLEFRQEQLAKEQSASGNWVEADGTIYAVAITGTKWTLHTDERPFKPDVEDVYGLGFGPLAMPGLNSPMEKIRFDLDVRNGVVTGTWQHPEIEIEKCMVPAETGPVEGTVDLPNGVLTLNFTKARYRVVTSDAPIFSFRTGQTCTDNRVLERRKVMFTFRGPMGRGRLGIVPTTAHGLMGNREWIGELRVAGVAPNTPAALAGLLPGDQILAIDGVAVNTLAANEAIIRLSGAPGSTVELRVLRKDQQPATVRLVRQVLAQ